MVQTCGPFTVCCLSLNGRWPGEIHQEKLGNSGAFGPSPPGPSPRASTANTGRWGFFSGRGTAPGPLLHLSGSAASGFHRLPDDGPASGSAAANPLGSTKFVALLPT